MKSKLSRSGLNNIEVDSCGTGQYHIGEQPDSRTIANAQENGITLDHRARQFVYEDFERFDHIIAMDRSNLQNIKRLDSDNNFADKLHLMRDFDPVENGGDVPDPYFGGERGFQEVFDILDRSIDHFLMKIR